MKAPWKHWLLSWRLKQRLPFYVQLAHTGIEGLFDREPASFLAAIAEVGRWITDYARGRHPISWIERRGFVRAINGEKSVETEHEQAFHSWLQSCWMADQYLQAQITTPKQNLYTPNLKALCAEREDEKLRQLHALFPVADGTNWLKRLISFEEGEARYQEQLIAINAALYQPKEILPVLHEAQLDYGLISLDMSDEDLKVVYDLDDDGVNEYEEVAGGYLSN